MTVRRTVRGRISKKTAKTLQRLPTFEKLFLQLSFCDFYLNCLVDLFGMATLVISIIFDRCREKGVDECSLAQARFASDLYVFIRPPWQA